eukprot:945638-Pelagomonas_calceolata.AAC.2
MGCDSKSVSQARDDSGANYSMNLARSSMGGSKALCFFPEVTCHVLYDECCPVRVDCDLAGLDLEVLSSVSFAKEVICKGVVAEDVVETWPPTWSQQRRGSMYIRERKGGSVSP